MKPLTPMQRAFAEHYMGDAQAAAIAAGYAPGSAKVTGCNLLKDERVRALIEKREDARQQAEAKAIVEAGPIMDRLQLQALWTRVALGLETDTAIDKDGRPHDVSPALRDRLKASELLGKSMAMFTDTVKHEAGATLEALVMASMKTKD